MLIKIMFSDLPDEIVENIAKYLENSPIARLAATSVYFVTTIRGCMVRNKIMSMEFLKCWNCNFPTIEPFCCRCSILTKNGDILDEILCSHNCRKKSLRNITKYESVIFTHQIDLKMRIISM